MSGGFVVAGFARIQTVIEKLNSCESSYFAAASKPLGPGSARKDLLFQPLDNVRQIPAAASDEHVCFGSQPGVDLLLRGDDCAVIPAAEEVSNLFVRCQ